MADMAISTGTASMLKQGSIPACRSSKGRQLAGAHTSQHCRSRQFGIRRAGDPPAHMCACMRLRSCTHACMLTRVQSHMDMSIRIPVHMHLHIYTRSYKPVLAHGAPGGGLGKPLVSARAGLGWAGLVLQLAASRRHGKVDALAAAPA